MRMKPWLLFLLVGCVAAQADDLAALVRDRAAIERVYYNHRLGQKPPFEQATPPALIERLVKDDLRKETALRKVYGVAITPALLAAEVERINTTTRAPEMLAEIKVALGNDPAKFAQTFAKPFLVERLLRDKFDNDEALHAPLRREAETLRGQLLEARAAKSDTRNPKAERRSPQSAVVTSNLLAILKGRPAANLLKPPGNWARGQPKPTPPPPRNWKSSIALARTPSYSPRRAGPNGTASNTSRTCQASCSGCCGYSSGNQAMSAR
jgi:hypothetical protein